jgi:ATP-dependent DNA ligase
MDRIQREGRTVEDIKDAMEDFVQQKYEGVVIKNKKKPYVLGERDDEVMIKLKPDYFTGFIHDLDVLILGAFIGTGWFIRCV